MEKNGIDNQVIVSHLASKYPVMELQSRKQIEYVKARTDGLTRTDSALRAGYDKRTLPSTIERSPKLRGALIAAFEKTGLSSEFLAQKIKMGLTSKKTYFYAHEGIVTDQRVVPDNETQHKYVRTAVEIRGDIIRDEGNRLDLNIGLVAIPEPAASQDDWNESGK